jgi:hypothetical protein
MRSFGYRYRIRKASAVLSYEATSRAHALVRLPTSHALTLTLRKQTRCAYALAMITTTHAYTVVLDDKTSRIHALMQLAPHLPPPLTQTHPRLYSHARRRAVHVRGVNHYPHICTHRTDVPRDHTPSAGPPSGGASPPTEPVVSLFPLIHPLRRRPRRATGTAGHERLCTQPLRRKPVVLTPGLSCPS